jgi:phage terminase small subunit
MASKLNDKQRRFVREFLVDLNGTQAAIRTGYAKNSASVQASRLLANANVQAELAKQQKKLIERTEVTAERVIEEYRRVAFALLPDYIDDSSGGIVIRPMDELSEEQAAALCEVTHTVRSDGDGSGHETVKVKLHNKLAALDALAKHLGLNAPAQVDVNVGIQSMDFGDVKIKF